MTRPPTTDDGGPVIADHLGDHLGDLLAGDWFRNGLLVGAAAGVAVGLATSRRGTVPEPRVSVGVGVAVSVLAAGGAYACTPDTELARLLTGAVVGSGAAAVATGLAWWWPSLLVTVALVVIAAHDGAPRASAVVATMLIAVLHLAGQLHLRAGTHPLAVVAVVAVAVALCSRVAGLADSAEAALLVALPTVLVAIGTLAAAGALSSNVRRVGAGQ